MCCISFPIFAYVGIQHQPEILEGTIDIPECVVNKPKVKENLSTQHYKAFFSYQVRPKHLIYVCSKVTLITKPAYRKKVASAKFDTARAAGKNLMTNYGNLLRTGLSMLD